MKFYIIFYSHCFDENDVPYKCLTNFLTFYIRVLETTFLLLGPFTAFIPTDAAFQKIPAPILQQLLNDQTAIRSLLLKHVTNGALISPFIKDGDKETSLGGTNLTLTKDANGVSSITMFFIGVAMATCVKSICIPWNYKNHLLVSCVKH